MNILLIRQIATPSFTLGRLYVDNKAYCYTCEDADRKLETNPGAKVHGQSAIPRGRYKVEVTYSHRFQKPLPELLDVPGFYGVRIHGGNTAADTEGCLLVGRVRTANGVAQCADMVNGLVGLIERATDMGEPVYIEVQ